MTTDRRDRSSIANETLGKLYDYWQRACRGRSMPTRRDVDPVDMQFVLPHLALIDVTDPLGFRIGLQGTEFERWMGADLTGRMLSEWSNSQLRDLAATYLLTVVDTGAPWHSRENHVLDGRDRKFEVLILPLAANDGAVAMLLAAVLCDR